jgi:hypothetical protein
MIDLEAEIEVVEALKVEAKAREDNLSTKQSLSAFDVINYGIFLMNVLVGKKAANYTELDEEDEMLLMSYVELYKSTLEEIWFLNLGCNSHMCCNPILNSPRYS